MERGARSRSGLSVDRRSWRLALTTAALLFFGSPQRPPVAEQAHAERATPRPSIIRTEPGAPQLRIVARAPAGTQPKSVRVSPDGELVYVCNFGRPDHESVTIHDARTLEQVGMIEFPGNAVEAAFSSDGQTLYVSNFRRHVVEVIDVDDRSVRAEIAVGQHPKTIAVSPDGTILYVANWGGQEVSVVDAVREVELRRLETGVHPRGLAVRPDGRLLVASFDSHFVQEFTAGGERELRRFPACQFPRHLVLSPVPLRLLVTCTLGSVGFYDLPTGHRFGLGSVGHNPRSMDVSTNGRWIATADFGLGGSRRGSVSLIDTRELRHSVTPIPRVERLVGLSIHPGEDLLIYATSWDTSEVIALSLEH